MVPPTLTRRQQEIFDYLQAHLADFPHPPTLDELCDALGLRSRGSLHKQIQALIDAGLVEPMNNLRRGIRLSDATELAVADKDELPLFGRIAAGQPIEAIPSIAKASFRLVVPPTSNVANVPITILPSEPKPLVARSIAGCTSSAQGSLPYF